MSNTINKTATTPNFSRKARRTKTPAHYSEVAGGGNGNAMSIIVKMLEVLSDTWITPEQWDAIRQAAGLQLDPETSEAMWVYKMVPDGGRVAKEYFFRSPGSEEWLRLGDLPSVTRLALVEKHGFRPAAGMQPSDPGVK